MSAVRPLVNTRLRDMEAGDLDDVAGIESAAYAFPWSMGIFCDCLRVGYVCRVLELEGRVIGYGILSLLADESHVLNLCISPDYRRMGFGRQLLRHLLEVSVSHDVSNVLLEVRPSNESALRLYRAHGFEQIGLRRDYYRAPDGREDALVLRSRLDRSALLPCPRLPASLH